MKLEALVLQSDAYTDEAISSANAVRYANKAVAVINSRLNTTLPFFVSHSVEYEALNDTWLMRLIVPYLNYSIKMNDSSSSEAGHYYQEFLEALSEFEEKFYEVLDPSYTENVSGNIYLGTVRNPNKGWFPGAR